ncbi:MAG: glutamate 5-kinase [Anaerostipes sp.]|jgi:glutamate 5-kinase|nr:glutamate 5-kinase [Anaerostipes sp.]
MNNRELLKDKKRIVVKVGTSSLIHKKTGNINLFRLEKLVRVLTDLHNSGKDVILVSSGAIGVGYKALGLKDRPDSLPLKQACSAIGQGQLMMIYQKLFAEYNQASAQILITKETMLNDERRFNAKNTFDQLLDLDVIPIVNENDTVSTEEIEFGDNDTLSAVVTAVVKADLLILLTDIDGLYTDDPHKNPEAKLISEIAEIDDTIENMAKGAVSKVGTGGMATKIAAANIVTDAGADMVIANSEDLGDLLRIVDGKDIGSLFLAHKRKNFNFKTYLTERPYFRKE